MASLFTTFKARVSQLVTIVRLMQRGVLKPDTAPEGGNTVRVLIGPANSAGQGYRWARALEQKNPQLTVTSMHLTAEDSFKFPIDLSVHAGYAAYSPSWQRKQFAVLSHYAGVLFESNRGVLGKFRGADVLTQIELLRHEGVQVGLVFHGSDVRDPDKHLTREPHSYFQVDPAFTETMRHVTARSQQLIDRAGVPVFVSTVDLLTDVPNAQWLPVVIDPKQWRSEQTPLSGGHIPKVVHVPSKSFIKGTELIEKDLRQMDDEGVIDYHHATNVPHDEMPNIYRDADIVLDQFRGGPYGVAACEAMAAGRIVVSHVPYRERILEHTGQEVPIIESTHDRLRDTLTEIINDPTRAQQIAACGPGFVARHHNGERSGRVLASWLETGRL